jgi:hypothetical protein
LTSSGRAGWPSPRVSARARVSRRAASVVAASGACVSRAGSVSAWTALCAWSLASRWSAIKTRRAPPRTSERRRPRVCARRRTSLWRARRRQVRVLHSRHTGQAAHPALPLWHVGPLAPRTQAHSSTRTTTPCTTSSGCSPRPTRSLRAARRVRARVCDRDDRTLACERMCATANARMHRAQAR